MNTPSSEQQFPTAACNKSTNSSATRSFSSSHASGGGTGGYSQSETIVQRSTPILFSTNRGLHLRVTKPQLAASLSSTLSLSDGVYNIRFCDLERWTTNRANTVSLEDTIASRIFNVALPLSQRSSFIPIKRTSVVRFNNTFSRFDEAE